jgi:adenosylcobinamide kinase/adenosylcobinamide-phosphate guanylyltransferase
MDSSGMLIYITGGIRSGKSRYAVELARALAKKVVFVATCLPTKDRELVQRIKRHRKDRPKHWRTIENRIDLAELIFEWRGRADLVLIDCLTLHVSGRLMQNEGESKICSRVERLCKAAVSSPITTVIVSNEVGGGLVPGTDLGRKFQNAMGRTNQIVARYAEKVVVMISGLPFSLKGAIHDR